MSEPAAADEPVTGAARAVRPAAGDSLAAARDALLRAKVVVPHTDADGLSAVALALRARAVSYTHLTLPTTPYV